MNAGDDGIKLAGLESLVLEELEKHLILNSNHLRTFEDARSEIVTYVEEKFGLRIRDSKRSKAELCKRSDPIHVVSSLQSGKGKWSSDPRVGCFWMMQHVFDETAMQARTCASKCLAKAIRASHGPRVKTKERAKRTMENPKEPRMRTKVSGLENSKSQASSDTQESAQTCPTDTSWNGWIVTDGTMAGVLMNGMMTGVLLDGTKVGDKRMTHPQAHVTWRFGFQCHQ